MNKIDTLIFDHFNTLCNADGWMPGAPELIERLSRRYTLILCSMSSFERLEGDLASHFSLFRKVYSREFMPDGKTLTHFRREFPHANAVMIGNTEDSDAILSDPQTPLIVVDACDWATRDRVNLILELLTEACFDDIYGTGNGSRCVTFQNHSFRFTRTPFGQRIIQERP